MQSDVQSLDVWLQLISSIIHCTCRCRVQLLWPHYFQYDLLLIMRPPPHLTSTLCATPIRFSDFSSSVATSPAPTDGEFQSVTDWNIHCWLYQIHLHNLMQFDTVTLRQVLMFTPPHLCKCLHKTLKTHVWLYHLLWQEPLTVTTKNKEF